MGSITFVCLANSRKMSGRCVAGKQLETGHWLRPVSTRAEGELSEEERRYCDGSDPKLLHIITVECKEPQPKDYQSENIIIDDLFYWERVGVASWADLGRLVDPAPGILWVNGDSTYHGLNDKVEYQRAIQFDYSLRLIHVPRLRLRVFASGAQFGNPKRSVQAQFVCDRQQYYLKVTDPEIERAYLAVAQEYHDLSDCFLTISLGEPCPHDNCCYKLVAAIISQDRVAQ